MSDNKVFSPFYNIKRTLMLMRVSLGCPLQPKNDSFTEFKFVIWMEIIRVFVVIFMTGMLHLFWVVIFLSSDGNVKRLIEFYNDIYKYYSTSTLDQLVTVLWILVTWIKTFSYFLFFKKCIKPFNTFCQEFCISKSKIANLLRKNFPECQQKCWKKITNSEKLIMYGQILNLIATTLFTIWYHIVTNKTKNGPIIYKTWAGLEVFATLVYFVQIFFTLFGPMCCTVELIICEVIGGLSEMFEDWQRILRCKIAVIELEENKTEQLDNISFSKDRKDCEM